MWRLCIFVELLFVFKLGMLTGDESMDDGNAYASGFNLRQSKKNFLKNLGYCPQFDSFIGIEIIIEYKIYI